jgi:putative endonuclease
MWYVYIIQCEDNSFYTGCTNDLARRFKEHKNGFGAKYTVSHKPVKILYSKECKNRSDAQSQESKIKSWPRNKKINLIKNKPV